MKTAIMPVALVFLCALSVLSGCARKKFTSWEFIQNPAVSAQIKAFVAEKEAQANATTNAAMPGFAPFFAAAEKGDWLAVSNTFTDLRKHAGQYDHFGRADLYLRGTAWQAVIEIWGTFRAYGEGNEKYCTTYANDIIQTIPPGGIYFGGTDDGRFLVTGMEKSQVNAGPFFLLTQNALESPDYLDYLRSMYGGKIYIPTADDSAKCFQDYMEDAQQRMQNHQLKPGEDVRKGPDGRVQVTGAVSDMAINGLLAKMVFNRNSNREFFVEEYLPIDWMYPYLEPHGLIFKLNHQPLPELLDEMVQRDHDYWTQTVSPMIGDWLNDDTSTADVCAFAEKVFGRRDLSGFTGDPQFVQNDYSCKMFSKERENIASLYAWRAQHATSDAEKQRMNDAADFAFRQAWALCPYSQMAALRYSTLLFLEKRFSDGLLVLETAAKMPELQGQAGVDLRNLVKHFQRLKQSQKVK